MLKTAPLGHTHHTTQEAHWPIHTPYRVLQLCDIIVAKWRCGSLYSLIPQDKHLCTPIQTLDQVPTSQ